MYLIMSLYFPSHLQLLTLLVENIFAVPFVYVTANKDAKVENGVLADVAPSILHILGLPQPAEMDGKDLIK